MSENDPKKSNTGDSISGRSAALYFAHDPSIAQLLTKHGIRVRDFILVSFLSDQGSLSIDQLSNIVSIDPRDLKKSVDRLAAAGLAIREPMSSTSDSESRVRLTGRGQDVAARIDKEL